MVWMSALGPALLILKSLSWLELLHLSWNEFGVASIVGIACMTTTIAALYATMGQSVTWRSLLGWLVRSFYWRGSLCALAVASGSAFRSVRVRQGRWTGALGGTDLDLLSG